MMLFTLLSQLHDHGVRLWLEGGELRFEAQGEPISAELLGEIERQRAEIIGFLREAGGGVEDSAESEIEHQPRDQPLQLSFAQQRFWFLCQLGGDTAPYNLTYWLRLRGPLDPTALAWSFGEIVRRHETLRTAFRLVGAVPSQVILPAEGPELPLVDVSASDDPLAAALAIAQRDAEVSFDLADGRLFKFSLIRLADDDHVLAVTMVHIITDGWSFGVLFQELSQLYSRRLAGQTEPLPELPVQFADYAQWQRQWYQRESAGLVDYWRAKLAGVPTLDLPTDRPRPQSQAFRGTRKGFLIPSETVAGVRAIGREEGATFFMAMLSVFDILLARYSGQEDIVVGTPVANRERAEAEGMIGLFLNTLVLRSDLSGAPTFRELLRRVREDALGAFEHQQMPFEQVVVELRPARDLSRNPLFQVFFNVVPEIASPTLGEASVELLSPASVTSMFDLSLFLGVRADGDLTALFEYDQDLFDEATIARMQRHYVCLLEQAISDPDASIWQLPMMDEPERHRLERPNQTAAEYPRTQCLHELISAQAAKTPAAVAVTAGTVELSYQALEERANQLAHYLIANSVNRGQLVGVALERSARMVVALLGVIKAGAAYVPLDPSYPRERLAFIARDAGLEVLVTEEELRELWPDELSVVVRLDTDAEAIAAQPTGAPTIAGQNSEQLAYVIFTSGSTGQPKGVQIEHRALVNFTTAMAARPGMTAADVLVAVTTISFDIAGLELYLPLLVGGRVVVATGGVESDGRRLAALLADCGCTVMQATPATWQLLLEAGWTGPPDFKILCGGEALPRELVERLLPHCGELWNMYGPTETTIWSMALPLTSADGVVPIGGPIANTQVAVIDRHGQQVPIGVPGELIISGDGLARGYLQRPELTIERFIDHPVCPGVRAYRTGDLVRWREDQTLEFLGRLDQQVKVRGFRIELGEIEHVLDQQRAIKECAVVARDRSSGDRQLVAHVVFRSGASATASEMREHLRAKLPDYMVPPAFVTRNELPQTPNGKVDRRALAQSELASITGSDHFEPPRTPTETFLASVWRELLEIERVGRNDNFFDLGGHSLLAMQVVFRVEKELGPEVHPMELLLNSLEQFADLCDRRKTRPDEPDSGLLGRLRQRLGGGRRAGSRSKKS